MYDELVKRLRREAVYLPEKFSKNAELLDALMKAADAIEELQKQLREEKVDNVNLTGWLAEEHANQCPYYIRNVHDRGDDSLCTKWECEVKVLPKWIPVTERLPENGEYVLCFCRANIVCVLRRDKDGDWYENPTHVYMSGFVTHWMPLPKAPEKESES